MICKFERFLPFSFSPSIILCTFANKFPERGIYQYDKT